MKINEVSQVFGIPAETLRYIEQQGLIHPARNASNGYREYDLDTFSELCEYIRFRNMGIILLHSATDFLSASKARRSARPTSSTKPAKAMLSIPRPTR